MRFDKLSIETKEKVGKYFKISGVLLVLLAVVLFGYSYFKGEVDRLEAVNAQYTSALSQMQELNTSVQASADAINGNNTQITKEFMSKEELIAFAGTASKATGCDIVRLSVSEPSSDGSIEKTNFLFEVKGNISQLNSFMNRIDSLNCRYMLNNISMRKTENFTWLIRENLDSFNLDWWDKGIDNSGEDENASEELTLDDVFGSSQMTLYLDLDFVTSEGVQ